MKMHKTILTLLAVMLATIGTTGTVVQADGPAGGPDFANVMDAETKTLYNELSSPAQDLMQQIWEQIEATAPQEAFGPQVAHYVASLRQDLEDRENVGPTITADSNGNCTSVTRHSSLTSGYSSAVTGSFVSCDALTVSITIQATPGVQDEGLCHNCTLAFAYITEPQTYNYWSGRSTHHWQYPTDEDLLTPTCWCGY